MGWSSVPVLTLVHAGHVSGMLGSMFTGGVCSTSIAVRLVVVCRRMLVSVIFPGGRGSTNRVYGLGSGTRARGVVLNGGSEGHGREDGESEDLSEGRHEVSSSKV